MAAPQNHWKLGLFVVGGLALALATVALLGARSMQRDTGRYVSYFNESVQGLQVGSPIKFRGVAVGTVGKIQVAPDHRHVEVVSELGLEELSRLGLDVARRPTRFGAPRKLEMSPDLRLQLASTGLTGVKFLQLDFFDVRAYPPPKLPFQIAKNYIPTAPSMMKSIEDSLTLVANSLPEITLRTAAVLGQIEVIGRLVGERHLPERIDAMLGALDGLLLAARRKLGQVDVVGLSHHAQRTLASVNTAAERLDGILARVDRDQGLLAGLERAGDAIGDTLRDTRGLGGQLEATLASVRAIGRSIRIFTEALEQDPDMLLKGRSLEQHR